MLSLSACGGGDDDNSNGGGGGSPGGGTTPGGVGAAGGTVTGPGGAQIVVPAGALTQNVSIAISASSNGAPTLGDGMSAVGQVYEFTPHGTAFASPVSVTVPFDASRVPAGETAALFKTNAATTEWEIVPNATVSGNTMVGQVSGFSWFVVALQRPSPSWQFIAHTADDQSAPIKTVGEHIGAVDDDIDFGPLSIAPLGHDLTASGEVFATASGKTYWVEAEAPRGEVSRPADRVGGETRFNLFQAFRKNEAGATLRFQITQALIEAIDNNGSMPVFSECPWAPGTGPADVCKDEVFGEVEITIAAVVINAGPGLNPDPGIEVPDDFEVLEAHQGALRLWGWQENWRAEVQTDVVYRHEYMDGSLPGPAQEVLELYDIIPVFKADHFEFTVASGAAASTDAKVTLKEPVNVEIDLSRLPIGTSFYIEANAIAFAHNRRGRESFVSARLRDPADSTGLEWEAEGLQALPKPKVLAGALFQDEPDCGADADEESGTLQFNAAAYGLPEFRNNSNDILVTRTGGSKGKVVARVATTTGGTAVPGGHYTPVSHFVVFGDGDTTPRAVTIPIVNDDTFSGANTIEIELEAVNNCANVGTPDTAIITILDDETPPPETYSVGGVISGLSGSGLVLEDVRTGIDVEASGNTFIFDYNYATGMDYEVRVKTQPTNPIQVCSVTNASGTLQGANIKDVAVSCTTPQATGSLDLTFGSNGKVVTGLSGGAVAMVLQPDGRILALSNRALARYNTDGSRDSAFGSGGEVPVDFSSGGGDELNSLVVQPDGRIVVAGFAQNGRTSAGLFNYDFGVVRFNADGTRDTTFGTSAETYIDFAGSTDRAYKVLLQPDGQLVVAGHANIGARHEFAVVRLTSTGAIDMTFGTNGRSTVSLAGTDFGYGAALQADGAIVVAGRSAPDGTTSPDVGVARFLATGAIDTSFGTGGTTRIDFTGTGGWDEATSVTLQPDGRLLITGHLSPAAADFLLARLNTNGSRDVSFDADGLVTADFIGQSDVAQAVAVQSDGRIVVTGSAYTSGQTVLDFAILRYEVDGSPDTDFGTDGRLIIDFFAANDAAEAIAIRPDGLIVVGGSARNGTSSAVGIVRVVP